jgi:acetyltransferase-like isoleucine patch superfamily enzyme
LKKGLKYSIRKWLGLRADLSWGYYATDFLFRKILRQNAGVTWCIHHTTTIHSPDKIKRGIDVYPGVSPGIYINAMNGLEIGDFSNIGPQVGIMTANHDLIDNEKHIPSNPVIIGRFCWIGKSVNIMPGIVLGDFTIVGAGAIVTKSFPEGYCVLAGNPARIIKYLDKKECNDFAKRKYT